MRKRLQIKINGPKKHKENEAAGQTESAFSAGGGTTGHPSFPIFLGTLVEKLLEDPITQNEREPGKLTTCTAELVEMGWA